MILNDPVLLRDPLAGVRESQAELRQVFLRAMEEGDSGSLDKNTALEQLFGRWLGVDFVQAVSSGATALELAMRVLGVGAGDGVIVDALHGDMVHAALTRLAAHPILVDVEATLPTMDPGALAEALDTRRGRGARAIIVQHRTGHPAALDALGALASDRGIPVIEEASEAVGAAFDGRRLGGIGAMGVFCLGPERSYSALGPAGLLATGDAKLAERARILGQELQVPMDGLRASIARVRLSGMEGAILRRQSVALRYDTALRGQAFRIPVERSSATHSYDSYLIRPEAPGEGWERRRAALGAIIADVEALAPCPLARAAEPMDEEERARLLPNALVWSREALSLPVYAQIPNAAQNRVVEALLGAPDGA